LRYEAIVLAGGSGKRMGGVLKPVLSVGGVPLITRVLGALGKAGHLVVVGPSELDPYLPQNVLRTQEDPPGGGPVAGIGAGFALRAHAESVIVAAGDLPFLTWDAITLLTQADAGCAVYVDDEGRRQPLVAVWQPTALESALYGVPKQGSSMRQLMAAASVAEVRWPGAKAGHPQPWYDCDTPEQLRAAEELWK
jgi:molybdopterin-guanine dinucleotide biosynthesis protein A